MSPNRQRTRLAPVRKFIDVNLSPEDAFRRFTEQIAAWWPLKTHSVGEESAETVVFETRRGGRIYERTRDGAIHLWGTVIACDPPDRVVFSWHPGREADTAQEVEVRFVASEAGTRLELEHRGWEALGAEAETMRSRYSEGWEYVLGRFIV